MKLLAFNSRAISSFIFDAGMSTRRCFDPHALRIRVNMSAIGSVMLIERFPVFPMVSARFRGLLRSESAVTASNRFLVVGHWFLAVANDQLLSTLFLSLPRSLPDSRNKPHQSHFSKRNSRKPECRHVAAGPPGHRAPVAHALGR